MNPEPVGVVLNGGASRRMGTDKSELRLDGRRWIERVATALAAGGITRVVAVGGGPESALEAGIDHLPDTYPGEGPLGAIVTALSRLESDILVCPVDVPLVDGGVVACLRRAAGMTPHLQVICAANGSRIEPLVAYYRADCVGPLSQAFEDGQRAPSRAMRDLRHGGAQCGDPGLLTNVNTPRDLARVDSGRGVGAAPGK